MPEQHSRDNDNPLNQKAYSVYAGSTEGPGAVELLEQSLAGVRPASMI
jgi:hypothetical protein